MCWACVLPRDRCDREPMPYPDFLSCRADLHYCGTLADERVVLGGWSCWDCVPRRPRDLPTRDHVFITSSPEGAPPLQLPGGQRASTEARQIEPAPEERAQSPTGPVRLEPWLRDQLLAPRVPRQTPATAGPAYVPAPQRLDAAVREQLIQRPAGQLPLNAHLNWRNPCFGETWDHYRAAMVAPFGMDIDDCRRRAWAANIRGAPPPRSLYEPREYREIVPRRE